MKFNFLVKYCVLLLGLPEEFKGRRRDKKDGVPYEEKEKLVLDGRYLNFGYYKISQPEYLLKFTFVIVLFPCIYLSY